VAVSVTVRAGPGQWFAEFVATFGLLLTIFGCAARTLAVIPFAVGLYITAAYWFTASTSFANPAVTIARALSDTYAGRCSGGRACFHREHNTQDRKAQRAKPVETTAPFTSQIANGPGQQQRKSRQARTRDRHRRSSQTPAPRRALLPCRRCWCCSCLKLTTADHPWCCDSFFVCLISWSHLGRCPCGRMGCA
jgi:hypothetical protein